VERFDFFDTQEKKGELKFMKKHIAKITATTFVAVLALPTLANAFPKTEPPVLAQLSSNYENSVISQVLVSAIDGSPFVANFNSSTNIISSYDMAGVSMGERQVFSVEDFWNLVAINSEITSNTQLSYSNRVNTSDNITYLPTISSNARFAIDSVTLDVPRANTANPQRDPRSVFVGGGLFYTSLGHNLLVLQPQTMLPSGVTFDAFFTNAFGDDTSVFYDVTSRAELNHLIRFRGEPYGVRVSSWDGPIRNMQFRFFATLR